MGIDGADRDVETVGNLFIPNGGLKEGPDGLKYEDYVMLWTSTLCTLSGTGGYTVYVMQTRNPDTGSSMYIAPWMSSTIYASRSPGRNVRAVKNKPTASE